MSSFNSQARLHIAIAIVVAFLLVFDGRKVTSFTIFLRESMWEAHEETSQHLLPVDLPINTNSTIGDDLLTIVHHPQRSEISVHLKAESRCTRPHLMGRLSGPLLSKIAWDEPIFTKPLNETASNLVVTGRYQVPKGGDYFLEIVLLMCGPVKQETCLENPQHHRLTGMAAAIHVAEANTNNTTKAIGYWYNTIVNASDREPLYTRYQPFNCRDEMALTPRCKSATDRTRFVPYRFQFEGSYKNLTQDSLGHRLLELQPQKHTVCYVGASHARVLTSTTETLFGGVLKVEQVFVKFPEWVDQTIVDDLMETNCTKVVVGFGQWDAGWPRNYLTPWGDYERKLQAAARWFQNLTMDVVFRRTHYNPIGDIHQCDYPNKANDWRNPMVIDQYNDILKKVSHQYGMGFFDTGEIMSAIWDSAEDWCHYKDRDSSHAEALYILDRLFQ